MSFARTSGALALAGSVAVRAVAALALAVGLCVALAAQALGAQAWRIDSLSDTTVAPGRTIDYFVQTANVGDIPMDGSQIDLVVRLPDGVTAQSASLFDAKTFHFSTCADARDGVSPVTGASSVICSNSELVPSPRQASTGFQQLMLRADVAPGASGTLTSTFTVSGGGAAAVSTVDPTRVQDAPPAFGIDAFDGRVFDAGGDPETQAGGHPDGASVSIDFNTLTNPAPLFGTLWPVEPVKDVLVDLPPGFVGDPTAVDRCTLPELAHSDAGFAAKPLCPATSQVGTTLVRIRGELTLTSQIGPLPVFNMVPPPGVPARFGFNIIGTVVVLDARLRSGGDYGLSIDVKNTPEALAIVGTTVDFWGVPASAAHDADRACPGSTYPADGGPTCASGAPLKPLLRNPTSCTDAGVGLPTTAHVDSWAHPGAFDSATWFSHEAPGYPAAPADWGPQVGVSGCDRVPFDPLLAGRPALAKTASPVGFSFDLTLPQTDEPDLVGESDLRKAVVQLPEGVRVSPSSADGLGGCSPAQIALGSDAEPTCPDASKIGTVTVETPLLPDPLQGAVYLATPHDNKFHSLLAVYIVAAGHGVVVKLPGKVEADPLTGRLTATFDDNPQLPFSRLHLEFKDGPRAPLMTPDRCGTYTTHAQLTGWNGRTVTSDSSFSVSHDGHGAPCPPSQFRPGFTAGTENPVAGRASTFDLALTRGDEDEQLRAVSVHMPDGVTGKIANATLCPAAAASSGACPRSSRIGHVTVGAGAGPHPFYIQSGRVYLTGPYKGAPFGLSIVVPAVAGPFDLGDVVVRSALFVDRHTAQVSVVSDPLPTILQGITLDVRDVRVAIDRPHFFRNPTDCTPKQIKGTIVSTAATTAQVSSRFQVANCARLGLHPRMILRVGARHRTRRNASTPFTTVLTQTRGQADLRRVKVSLPTTLNARLPVVNRACTRPQFEAGDCARARAGSAVAITPLLKAPLRGGVYFVRNGHPIPDIFVALRGQVDFDLIGRVSIPGGKHLATTFNAIPDVPIRKFTLTLVAGSHGPVGAATNLCTAHAAAARASIAISGQNGRTLHLAPRLAIRGCSKHTSHRRARGHHH